MSDDEVTDQLFDGFVRVSVPSDNLEVQGRLPVGRDGLRVLNFKDPKTKVFDMKLYERALMAHDPKMYKTGLAITGAAIFLAMLLFFMPVIKRFAFAPD